MTKPIPPFMDYAQTTPCYISIKLPDFFQSFVRDTPKMNPFYESVKLESEEWLHKECGFSPKVKDGINRCDFSYFCAIVAPLAPRDRFRTVCDWGNWVFPYDDAFDNGDLRDQPKQAELIMDSLMATMLGDTYLGEKLPVVKAHDSIFLRLSSSAPGVPRRFAKAMQAYCRGALAHVDDHAFFRTPYIEQLILTRRDSAGVSPLYHLVEYAHGLNIPNEVFDSPVIQELEILGMDLVSISNDILSYVKEEAEGVPHNMIAVCRMKGMSAQEAFDAVGQLMSERYRRWDEVEERLPIWDSSISEQAKHYVTGIKSVIIANIYWSFKSERYFGLDAEAVRSNRTVKVQASPPYLNVKSLK